MAKVDIELHRQVRAAREAGDVRSLMAALESVEGHRAADYLGELNAAEAAPKLTGLLESADPHLRAACARALGKLGEGSAASALSDVAAMDAVPWVRSWALAAVADVQPFSSSREVFWRALGDPDIRVRLAAVDALGRLGNQTDEPTLRDAMKREHWWSRSRYRKALAAIRRR